jgi:hypothetical protein
MLIVVHCNLLSLRGKSSGMSAQCDVLLYAQILAMTEMFKFYT